MMTPFILGIVFSLCFTFVCYMFLRNGKYDSGFEGWTYIVGLILGTSTTIWSVHTTLLYMEII